MKLQTRWMTKSLAVFLLVGLVLVVGPHQKNAAETEKTVVSAPRTDIQVPPPPFSEGIFPCSECHGTQEPNPTRRVLTDAHEDIVLHHDEKNRWCLDCHDMKNRDKLHMADGRLLNFEESYKLCGQCHGLKLRDWQEGVHGRRIGSWNGQKQYLLCAHCHNPHSPGFKKIAPMPAPQRPEKLK